MFFIIASRIPIISADSTNRKYFKLFVVGALLYTIVHYYLHSKLRDGALEKLRTNMYYIMAIDYTIACVLLKYVKVIKPDEIENDNESEENKTVDKKDNASELEKLREEQRRLIIQQHQRKLQEEKEAREKAMKEQAVKLESATESVAERKKSRDSDTKSNDRHEKKKEKKRTEVVETEVTEEEHVNITDTDIPIYDK